MVQLRKCSVCSDVYPGYFLVPSANAEPPFLFLHLSPLITSGRIRAGQLLATRKTEFQVGTGSQVLKAASHCCTKAMMSNMATTSHMGLFNF